MDRVVWLSDLVDCVSLNHKCVDPCLVQSWLFTGSRHKAGRLLGTALNNKHIQWPCDHGILVLVSSTCIGYWVCTCLGISTDQPTTMGRQELYSVPKLVASSTYKCNCTIVKSIYRRIDVSTYRRIANLLLSVCFLIPLV